MNVALHNGIGNTLAFRSPTSETASVQTTNADNPTPPAPLSSLTTVEQTYGLTASGAPQAQPNAFGDANPTTYTQYYTTPAGTAVAYTYEGTQKYWNGNGVWSAAGYASSVTDPLSGFINLITNRPGLGVTGPSSSGSGTSSSQVIATAPEPNTTVANPITTTPPVDPILAALLADTAAGAQGASTGASTGVGSVGGLAATPIATTATTGSGGSSILLVIFLVVAAVGGYFIWKHYSGKIAKKEGA
jgi:hypothetical protein